jgi:hypothetical protein
MVQPPSNYHIAQRFLLALKIEIQTVVIRFGFHPENHDLETIYEAARQVKLSQTYEQWDDIQKQRHSSKEPKDKGTKKITQAPFKQGTSLARRPLSSSKLGEAGPQRGGSSSSSHIECFNCKQKGHYSSNCLKRSSGRKSVNYAEATPNELEVELVNAV